MSEKKPYRLNEPAQQDLEDIWDYIQENNPIAANKLEAKFYTAFEKLARFPQLGHVRDDIPAPLRIWNLGRYLIIYDPAASPLTIVRILSSYRDMTRAMQ